MSTPTLPTVDVHAVTDRVSERAGDVGEIVSDAWSTGLGKAQDLAGVAFEVLEDVPDKAIALAGAVIPALRSTPRRSRKPFVILAVVLASLVVVGYVAKKRRRQATEPYAVPGTDSSQANISAAS